MRALSVIRRFVWWPVFGALAVLHLVVLPLVLSEHEDDVLSLVAGAGYVVLAVVDVLVRRRDVASARGRRRRSIDGSSWEEPAG